MRYYYLDSSVLVKAYLWEEGTEDVLQLHIDARANPAAARIITSRIAYPEAMSPVARKERDGTLTKLDADALFHRIKFDFVGPKPPYLVIDPTPPILSHAADLVRTSRLRGYDAVHLATALASRSVLPDGVTTLFGCRDKALSGAASHAGFQIFAPATPIPASVTSAIT